MHLFCGGVGAPLKGKRCDELSLDECKNYYRPMSAGLHNLHWCQNPNSNSTPVHPIGMLASVLWTPGRNVQCGVADNDQCLALGKGGKYCKQRQCEPQPRWGWVGGVAFPRVVGLLLLCFLTSCQSVRPGLVSQWVSHLPKTPNTYEQELLQTVDRRRSVHRACACRNTALLRHDTQI